MLTIALLAVSGIIIGVFFAFLTRRMPVPPAHILLPILVVGVLIAVLIIWFNVRSAVELPSFLKK